jgi:hypothetical protein
VYEKTKVQKVSSRGVVTQGRVRPCPFDEHGRPARLSGGLTFHLSRAFAEPSSIATFPSVPRCKAAWAASASPPCALPFDTRWLLHRQACLFLLICLKLKPSIATSSTSATFSSSDRRVNWGRGRLRRSRRFYAARGETGVAIRVCSGSTRAIGRLVGIRIIRGRVVWVVIAICGGPVTIRIASAVPIRSMRHCGLLREQALDPHIDAATTSGRKVVCHRVRARCTLPRQQG